MQGFGKEMCEENQKGEELDLQQQTLTRYVLSVDKWDVMKIVKLVPFVEDMITKWQNVGKNWRMFPSV